MPKYIRRFRSLQNAIDDQKLVSPNVSYINDNNKLLMKNTGVIDEPLEIAINGKDIIIREKIEKVLISYYSIYGTTPMSKQVNKGYILTLEDLPQLTASGKVIVKWDKNPGDVINMNTTITATWINAQNTIIAGKYCLQATLTSNFSNDNSASQFLGTHKYGVSLVSSPSGLSIDEDEIGSNNNFIIADDKLIYNYWSTLHIADGDFQICNVDGSIKNGTLYITKNENDAVSIENFGILYHGIFIGTCKNAVAKLITNEETDANITFEDIEMPDNPFYNGDDEAGYISTATDFSFINYYNPDTSMWNGFAASRTYGNYYMSDVISSTYNSCNGAGMESKQFVIGCYNENVAEQEEQYPDIYATKNMKPQDLYITNSALIYNNIVSHVTTADFYKVNIIGYDENGEETGRVAIDLISNGNINNVWALADLTNLSTCAFIRFTVDCSSTIKTLLDNACNGNMYFCLDNLNIELTDEPCGKTYVMAETYIANCQYINEDNVYTVSEFPSATTFWDDGSEGATLTLNNDGLFVIDENNSTVTAQLLFISDEIGEVSLTINGTVDSIETITSSKRIFGCSATYIWENNGKSAEINAELNVEVKVTRVELTIIL